MRTNDSQKTWTDRLNEALALRGKSPADISKATGITPAGIKKWIDGDVSRPKFDDVFAVCSFLDITTEWLMKGIGSINDKTMPAANMVSIQQVDFYGSCGVGVMNFEDYPEIKTLQVTPAWFSRNFAFSQPRTKRFDSSRALPCSALKTRKLSKDLLLYSSGTRDFATRSSTSFLVASCLITASTASLASRWSSSHCGHFV